MTSPLTVPAAPPLATVANVELMHTGTWPISTGVFTFTATDLANAVAALDCPAVRRPVLKLGHTDPRFDGEPAVGWVANLATAEAGRTLVGDYAGMPGWLGDVIASAYPDRSIEGEYDFRCQMGHTHPFVLTAVALLGVTAPGIGTLQSLQDVAGLYGVAAAAADPTGTPVTIRINASKEPAMPNPRPLQVAAAVTSEDVRRKYYAENPSWDLWIEEMQLEPLQLIVCNDATGARQRVPVTIGAGDGEAAVSFGDPVTVVIRYEDAGSVAAAAGRSVRYASKAESRPQAPRATGTGPSTNQEGAGMDPAKLREALGLPADASDTEVSAAMETAKAALTAHTAPDPTDDDKGEDTETTEVAPAPQAGKAEPKAPEGYALVPAPALADLQASAKAGATAAERFRVQDRDAVLKAAFDQGKIMPRDGWEKHWAAAYDRDPDGTKAYLASAPQLVPVNATGYTGGEETSDPAAAAGNDYWFAGFTPADVKG